MLIARRAGSCRPNRLQQWLSAAPTMTRSRPADFGQQVQATHNKLNPIVDVLQCQERHFVSARSRRPDLPIHDGPDADVIQAINSTRRRPRPRGQARGAAPQRRRRQAGPGNL